MSLRDDEMKKPKNRRSNRRVPTSILILNNFKYKQFILCFYERKRIHKAQHSQDFIIFYYCNTFSLFYKIKCLRRKLVFSFCYKAYGFPFLYAVTGQVDAASGYLKTLPLGNFFSRYGNFLFNIPAFVVDVALIYIVACFVFLFLEK